MVGSLAADVEALSSDLKAVKGKLDEIMSLLLNMASGGQNRAVSGDPVPRSLSSITGDSAAAATADEGGGGDGGGVRFGGGAQGLNAASFFKPEPHAVTTRGGHGHGQWPVGGGSGAGAGSIRRGGHDPYSYGAVLDYRAMPRDPVDHHQQHGWRLPQSRPSQQLYESERDPLVPNQVSRMTAIESRGCARIAVIKK